MGQMPHHSMVLKDALNEGKFVLNIDFIMALKPDGLCVYETTKQDSILISVYL